MTAMIDLHPTADPDVTEPSIDAFVLARVVAFAGLAAIVLASFGPWLRSGERSRTSFELFEVVDRLGLLGDGALRLLPLLWVCVPCLAAVAVALFVCRSPKLAAAVTAVVGGFSLIVGWAVQDTPLTAQWGSRAGVGGGFLALLGATAVFTTALINEFTGASDRAPARERPPRACAARERNERTDR
jgi:hypothetical protein